MVPAFRLLWSTTLRDSRRSHLAVIVSYRSCMRRRIRHFNFVFIYLFAYDGHPPAICIFVSSVARNSNANHDFRFPVLVVLSILPWVHSLLIAHYAPYSMHNSTHAACIGILCRKSISRCGLDAVWRSTSTLSSPSSIVQNIPLMLCIVAHRIIFVLV